MTEVWQYFAILGSFTGLGHLVLFLRLLFPRAKEREQRLALLYLGLSLLWGVAVTLADLQAVFLPIVTDPADRLIPVLSTALSTALLVLVSALLEHPILPILATAGGTWSAILFLATVYSLIDPSFPIPLLQISQGGWAVLVSLLVGLIVMSLFHSRLALHRNRALYWLLTAVPLLGGQALSILPAGPLRGLGSLLHLAGAIAVMRGAISYWLPNVKATLRSILRALFLFCTTTALLLGIALGAAQFTERLPLSHTLLALTMAASAALIYLPLVRLLDRLIERLLQRVGFDPAQALREYSQTITTVLDLEELARQAVSTVAEVLDVQRGALLVATETERGGLLLQPVPGMGQMPTPPLELEPISPILAHIRQKDEPLFQYEVEHHPVLRQAAKTERAGLHALEMEVYLPIRSKGELTGFLALGPQGTGEPYGPIELAFLSTLAQQTGVALQNARLFEGLRDLNMRITELNENLRAAYERLERLDRAKTDFLTIASHELRTPLTQVRGYVDILIELAETGTLAPDQVRRIAENISRPTRRLERIIDAIMDASQIDTEGLSLRFVPTTLVSTVRLAVEPWLPALEERNITLVTRGLDEIPAISADMERLCQAFSNLISNAIKFTPDGGRITIEAYPLDEEHFKVTVSDTGIGISPADQELIFEKFYRVGSVLLHSSGEFKFKGAGPGLGLPIARGVIEGHGGCIWVESEGYDEERCPGTTFHIVLPYVAHRGRCRWKQPESRQPSAAQEQATTAQR